jgi:hypothetical protein
MQELAAEMNKMTQPNLKRKPECNVAPAMLPLDRLERQQGVDDLVPLANQSHLSL